MRDDVGLKKRLDSSIVLWNRRFKTGELPSFLSLPKMGGVWVYCKLISSLQSIHSYLLFVTRVESRREQGGMIQ